MAIRKAALLAIRKFVGMAASERTIASGVISVTQLVHTIDTQGDASSDDLDSITGGQAEQMLIVRPASAARTVVLKHAIGADLIATPGGIDISLAEATDWAILCHNGTQWSVVASSALVDTAAALVAANTDAVEVADFVEGMAAAGTWTLTRQGTASMRLRRTAAAALEVWGQRFKPRSRSAASKGFRVTGFRLVYNVSVDLVTDVTVSGAVQVAPATGSTPAAATSLGAVTYDAAHDTAGERGAVGAHTMVGTFASPLWLANPTCVELAVSVDGSATGVVDIIGIELLGSEALLDTTV
jgi:hypothetical protein